MAPKKTATKAAAKPVKRLTTKGKPTADEQAKQVRRKNQANMVTQVKNAHDKLLKVQKGEIAVSDKEQEDLQVKAGFYARYITLDRFAPEKLDMLESFMNDKTCNSWLQREKSTASVSSTMGGSNEGWVSRFEIAKEEGLPEDHPVLKAMLLKLPQDDDWDVAIPWEAAMKEAGEKHFWYCRKVLTEIRGGVTEKDGVQGGGDFKRPLALDFLGQESGKSQGVTVKAEFPKWLTLQAPLKVLRTGKAKVQKEVNVGKDMLKRLEQIPGLDEYQNAVDTLEKYQESLRMLVTKLEGKPKEDVGDDDLDLVQKEIDVADAHLDAFKRATAKVRKLEI